MYTVYHVAYIQVTVKNAWMMTKHPWQSFTSVQYLVYKDRLLEQRAVLC